MHNEFSISRKAFAKLNLHLQVLNRRNDNFHNIFSIMAETGIYDLLKLESWELEPGKETLNVEIVNAGGEYSSLLNDIPPDKNLISVAVKRYLGSLLIGGHLRFSIEKNIPSGAGIGGGSSDAASALELVRGVLKNLRDESFFAAAAESGSDVPFFLSGGAAFAEGRGEIIQQIDSSLSLPVVLVNNGIHVNTGGAYSSLKRGYDSFYTPDDLSLRKKEMLSVFEEPSAWKDHFVNDFEKPVFDLYPGIGRLKQQLYDLGADFALMSGSGSSVYGVFKEENRSHAAADELEKCGNRVFRTKMEHCKIND